MKAVAEAPCKVIITGEHFVVHGAWALAAALGKRTRVEVGESDRFSLRTDLSRPSPSALSPLRSVVDALAREHSFSPELSVEVTSAVPDGAGLGSSAATLVALAAAVSKLKGLHLPTEEVIEAAMVGEREVHGRPSGIDATTCAMGGVILFRMGAEPRRVVFDGERRFLVVYSGRRRSTKKLIERVSVAERGRPGAFSGLSSAASQVSLIAAEKLAEGEMDALGGLLTFNQAALASVGASTESLDRLVDELLSLGCKGAKLTGAGGGGSLIAVPPEGKEKSTISSLLARGFEAFEARVPVGGVRAWLRR